MRKVLMGAGLALALAACSQPANELTGRWQVQEIAGASLGEGVDVWIAFDQSGEQVSGFTGCNNFTTTAEQFGTGVSFAPVTEEAGECASQAAATDEARFLGVLPSVQRYIRHGRSLELLPAQNGSEALLRLRLADEQGG
ncbi:MAG: META domain-containing protein [Hyphomonadaceae bacterium]|nr:META domain-containing protein [Hyphomonadaceae bacterium]